jgi:hypothetical protein
MTISLYFSTLFTSNSGYINFTLTPIIQLFSVMMKYMVSLTQQQNFSTHQSKEILMMKHTTHQIQRKRFSTISLLVAMLLMIVAPPSLVQAAVPVAGFGTALDFDGTDDYVDLDSHVANFVSLNQGTIAGWFKTNSITAQMVFSISDNSTNNNQIWVGLGSTTSAYSDESIHFSLKRDSIILSMLVRKGQTFYQDGKWHHFAIVSDDGDNRIYMDGTSQPVTFKKGNATTNELLNINNADRMRIGNLNREGDQNLYQFQGQIDEVRVWNVARSQAQIQADMYSPLTGSESGLVGYWPFEEGSGTTASDNTTNTNNGKLTNMDNSDWVDGIIGNPTFTTNENTSLSDTLSAYDADGDALTYSIGDSDGGTAVITDASTGAFTYTPATSGTRTFTYQVYDGSIYSNIASVTVEVIPNNAPIAGFGRALDFDGTDDLIDIGTLKGEMLGSLPRTIEAWVKTTSTAEGSIFKYGKNVKNGRINIRTGDKRILIETMDSMTVWEAPTVNDGNWHHVAWSYSNETNLGDGTVYVDGIALNFIISNVSDNIPPNTQSGAASIGSRINGRLDEVRVWNVARTQAQIQANMYKPLTGSESGLVGYWPFEEGSGTAASDKTTNGNDGTLIKMDNSDWVNGIIGNFTFTTNENTSLSETLSAYDADGDALTYSIGDSDGGAAVITDASTGAFTYTPATSGTRTFTYQVNDGSVYSNIASVTVTVVPSLPNAPTNLSGSAASQTQINLSWTDNSTNETGFKVERSGTTPITTTAANATSYTDSGLSCGTTYSYSVIAFNAVDDSTAVTVSVKTLACSKPVLNAPTNLTATATSQTQINLTWADNSTNETGFKVERAGTPITTTAANATSYSDSGLSCGTTYSYSVIATNANGDSTAVTASATTLACSMPPAPVPNAPTDLSGSAASQTQINLSWTDNSTDETGFKVERAGSLITTTAADATSYSDSGLSCSMTYSYSIKATNASGDSIAATIDASASACSTGYNLTVNKTGNGTVSGVGISCGTDCQENFAEGTNINLTATPENGWLLSTWSGDCVGTNTSTTITLDADKTCTPVFIEPPPVTSRPIIANPNNFGGQAITDDISIEENRSISNVVFKGNVVKNEGLISNSTIGQNTTLTGGKLTGTIINEGTIADINFVGMELSGGTLSGYIVNSSKVGGIIRGVQLAKGAVLKGGKLGGRILGNPEVPALIIAAKILPGTYLSNVRLSPTVELPKDVFLGPGVILLNEPPTLADFGLKPEDIAKLTVKTLVNLYLSFFAALTAEDVAKIPPAAFAGIKPAQIAVIQKEALGGMTTEQFKYTPVNTLSGLRADNMGGLPTEVIAEFTSNHLDALNVKAFKAMPSEDISKLFTHLNANKITPQNVEKLVPKTWELDLKTGALTLPIGTKATLQSLPLQLPSNVTLPIVSHLGAGFGLGGGGTPLIEEAQRSLAGENLANFVLSQDENGILLVEGTGDAKGVLYTFIPDAENAIIVDTDKMPIGLSVGAGGFYTIITPDGLQFKVIPAPKDPVALSQSLGGGEVVIGKRGDVLLELSNQTRRRGARQVVIMDPFIEPTPDELLCREIIPGVVICDKEVIPPKRLLRDKSNQTDKVLYKVIYPDNTAQTVRPTLLSPDVFIEEALKFKGVQQVVYNANGTFHVLYRGKIYTIVPNFNITSRETSTDETIVPSIVLNDNGTLTYTIAIDVVEKSVEEENRRFGRRRGARSVLTFDPFIEPAPEDVLCRELFPGKTVCDFEIKNALIR